jgi:hypothetical protein
MIVIDHLKNDHAALKHILQDRRTISVETLPIGTRVLWSIYITILEDALYTLISIIDHLVGDELSASYHESSKETSQPDVEQQ